MGAARKAPVIEQRVKKTVKTEKVVVAKPELEKMSDKLTPNMAVSIPDGDFRYKRAWIIFARLASWIAVIATVARGLPFPKVIMYWSVLFFSVGISLINGIYCYRSARSM